VQHAPKPFRLWLIYPTALASLAVGGLSFLVASDEATRNGNASATATLLALLVALWPLYYPFENWRRRRAFATPRCSTTKTIEMTFDAYSGITTFLFSDDNYADAFAEANAGTRVY
jgi:hypothetical protein